MGPDREDRSPAHAWLREARHQRSLVAGWLTLDDWRTAEVDAVLAACRYPKAH